MTQANSIQNMRRSSARGTHCRRAGRVVVRRRIVVVNLNRAIRTTPKWDPRLLQHSGKQSSHDMWEWCSYLAWGDLSVRSSLAWMRGR